MERSFMDCNLSTTPTGNTTLNNVKFAYCKLMGLSFAACNALLLRLAYEGCKLGFANLRGLKLKAQSLLSYKLNNMDFSDCDLSKAKFDTYDLDRAIFSRNNLTKADCDNALNFTIDLDDNKLTVLFFPGKTAPDFYQNTNFKSLPNAEQGSPYSYHLLRL